MTLENVKHQESEHDVIYSTKQKEYSEYHITTDPWIRYLRDRRLIKGLNTLKKSYPDIFEWKILITCGGVGGEGMFFLKNGFKDVTVTDISEASLKICNMLEPSLKTIKLNGENLDLPDNSFDLVVVQDGLHHLPRPATGFTEMLRIATKAIIVIEPHDSFVGNFLGTEWELTGTAVNYVFRWNNNMVTQTVKSMLLKNYKKINVLRFWDHSLSVHKLTNKLPESLKLRGAKLVYSLLKPFDFLGNMMVAVVEK